MGGSSDGAVLSDVERRLIGFPDWVARRKAAVIVAFLILVSLLKSGFAVWNWFHLSPMLLTNWEAPNNSFQSNVLFNAFGSAWSAVGLDPTSVAWLTTQVVMAVAVIVVVSLLVLRRTKAESSYLALAAILSSGIAVALWREIGRYDALFIVGVVLAVLAIRPWAAWLGAAVAALSSPEQSLVAGAILLLLAVTPPFREWRIDAVRLMSVAAVVLVAVQVWFTVGGDPYKTRIGILLPFISGEKIEAATAYDPNQGFVKFTIEKIMVTLSAGPSLVWSYLGATALLFVLCLLLQRSWLLMAYSSAVVVIVPLLVSTLFGEDRTRDLVMISAPTILVIAIVGSRTFAELAVRLPGGTRVWLTWAAVIVTMIPLTYFYLSAEEPFHWAKELLISINNGMSFPLDGSAR